MEHRPPTAVGAEHRHVAATAAEEQRVEPGDDAPQLVEPAVAGRPDGPRLPPDRLRNLDDRAHARGDSTERPPAASWAFARARTRRGGHDAPVRIGVLFSDRTDLLASLSELAGAEPQVELVAAATDRPHDPAQTPPVPLRDFAASRFGDRVEHNLAMAEWLLSYRVDLVATAGWLWLLSAEFLDRFPNRVVNVHPTLLPAFPGAPFGGGRGGVRSSSSRGDRAPRRHGNRSRPNPRPGRDPIPRSPTGRSGPRRTRTARTAGAHPRRSCLRVRAGTPRPGPQPLDDLGAVTSPPDRPLKGGSYLPSCPRDDSRRGSCWPAALFTIGFVAWQHYQPHLWW